MLICEGLLIPDIPVLFGIFVYVLKISKFHGINVANMYFGTNISIFDQFKQPMKDLILVGGGGHCKSVIDVIDAGQEFNIVGILDMPDKLGQKILQYEVIGSDADIEKLSQTVRYFFISVGQIDTGNLRMNLYRMLQKMSVNIPTILSPNSYVAPSAVIGEGSIVMHQAMVNAGSKIGNNCIINSKALIEHDVSIGDHCHISTGSILNGGVIVKDHSFIGSNAVCVQNTVVPENHFMKASTLYKG